MEQNHFSWWFVIICPNIGAERAAGVAGSYFEMRHGGLVFIIFYSKKHEHSFFHVDYIYFITTVYIDFYPHGSR